MENAGKSRRTGAERERTKVHGESLSGKDVILEKRILVAKIEKFSRSSH